MAGGSPGLQVAGSVALKGKPETGINASVMYPQPIIRSPYAAPFEIRLFCSTEPLSLRAPLAALPRLLITPVRAHRQLAI